MIAEINTYIVHPKMIPFCRCILVLAMKQSNLYNQMQLRCKKNGDNLISFLNQEELDELSNFITSKGRLIHFALGLQGSITKSNIMYRTLLQWTNGRIAFGWRHSKSEQVPKHTRAYQMTHRPLCGHFKNYYMDEIYIESTYCQHNVISSFICERIVKHHENNTILLKTQANITKWKTSGVSVIPCPNQQFTHNFLICDYSTNCYANSKSLSESICAEFELFTCGDGLYSIPYTLVCDLHDDCLDRSDEQFCHFEPCSQNQCSNGHCLDWDHICDGNYHCIGGADEEDCIYRTKDESFDVEYIQPPKIVNLEKSGYFSYNDPLNISDPCPVSHFLCPKSYCLPAFLRCNGVEDCSYGEDELHCEDYQCPGFYRCRGSRICLYKDHLCDAISHCPQMDDERFCHLQCPSQHCLCHGFQFKCHSKFPADTFTNLRYLDAVGTGSSPEDLQHNKQLIFLDLSRGNLQSQSLHGMNFPNLKVFIASNNNITYLPIYVLKSLPSLAYLKLASNPVTVLGLYNDILLEHLDISQTNFDHFNETGIASFYEQNAKLTFLNISGITLNYLPSFSKLYSLQHIDITGVPATYFSKDIFKGLDNLQSIRTSNFKFCCAQLLPSQVLTEYCHSPKDEISSCDSLLRSSVYRVFLWLFCVVAVFGNFASFILRTLLQGKASDAGFPVLVASLALSDCVMGIYLALIGMADHVYSGDYLWKETSWRKSITCQVTRFSQKFDI